MKRLVCVLILSGLIILFSVIAEAASFQAPSLGARATGMAGAYVAVADDPLAVYWNPAGLAEVDGKQIMIGSTFVKGYASYEAPKMDKEENKPAWQPIPHVAFSMPVNDAFAWGAGVYTPFGLSQEWDDDSVYNYNSIKSEINLTKLRTAVSWRASERFAVGAGIGVDWGSIEAKQAGIIVLPGPTYVPGFVIMEGDDTGYSGTIGFIWSPADQWKIGSVWRSATKMEFDGDVDLDFGAPVGSGADNFSLDFTFPQMIAVGVSYAPSEKWLVSAQVDWTDWSTTDTLKVDMVANPDMVIPRDWNDTYSIRLGTEYKVNDNWSVRGGYMWDPTPVPPETLDPMMFDVSTHRVSMGLGYTTGNWKIDAAYMYSIGTKDKARDSKNVIPDLLPFGTEGDYRGGSHVAEVTFTYRF